MKKFIVEFAQATLFVAITFVSVWVYLYNMKPWYNLNLTKRKPSMTAKTVNYTQEQTTKMVMDYTSGVTVETIAQELQKSVRSIVAKLSREKVYVAKAYVSKTGEAVVKKDVVADYIGQALGLSESDCESLTKANKTALKAIADFIRAEKTWQLVGALPPTFFMV